jgi:hypothetical protein
MNTAPENTDETTPTEPFTLARTQSDGRDVLKVTCNGCRETTTQPDKGLGRASISAWKTRHQH